MFSIRLHRAEHVRQYSVQSSRDAGWEVSLREDRALTRSVRYDDWHRVERALAVLRREVADLRAQGWEIESSS